MNGTLSGLVLLDQAREGIYEGIAPENLAGMHPLLARDMAALEPFEREGGVWRACGAEPGAGLAVCGPCTSTMDVAWSLLEDGFLAPWNCVVSPVQQSGRGQLRRPWSSSPGNLHLSLIIPSAPGAPGGDPGTLLPLAVGYVFCRVLEEAGLDPVMKWPNDVLVQGRKVAGILVEDRGGRIVAGIGVNIAFAPTDADMRANHSNPAGCLRDMGLDTSPLGMAVTLVKRGRNWYERLLNLSSPHGRITEIEKRIAWLGQDVAVEGTGRARRGRILGLNPDGGLLVEADGVRDVWYSGSIRPFGDC